MTDLLERRIRRMAAAYARLLDAYIYSNRLDREKLIAEARFLIADAKWGFAPPLTCRRCDGTGRQIAERYDGLPGPSALMEACMRCLGTEQ